MSYLWSEKKRLQLNKLWKLSCPSAKEISSAGLIQCGENIVYCPFCHLNIRVEANQAAMKLHFERSGGGCPFIVSYEHLKDPETFMDYSYILSGNIYGSYDKIGKYLKNLRNNLLAKGNGPASEW